jgi:hypothetical protein
MESKAIPSQVVGGNRWLLAVAWSLYVAYLFVIWAGGGFESNFWRFDWRIFYKLCLVIIPIYIFIFRHFQTKFFSYDLWFLLVPFLLWFLLVAFIYTEKSLFNAVFVEPEMIIIFSGLYLLAAPISNALPNIPRWGISVLLVIAISLATCAVAKFVPFLPE